MEGLQGGIPAPKLTPGCDADASRRVGTEACNFTEQYLNEITRPLRAERRLPLRANGSHTPRSLSVTVDQLTTFALLHVWCLVWA
jgi:hypothetical protein